MGKFIPLGGSDSPVGYCHYHHFTLSKNQLKQKDCLNKQCARLEKYNEHPFWKNKEKKKDKREKRKIEIKEKYKMIDTNKLKAAIKYCKGCPEGTEKSLNYCSECPYSEKCMAGIMDLMYDYLITYDIKGETQDG